MNEPARRTRRARAQSAPERPVRTSARLRFVVGGLVLSLGFVALAASNVTSRAQHHAYDAGAQPPASVHLTAGKHYQLSSPGGVQPLVNAGVLAANVNLTCVATPTGGGIAQLLTLQDASGDTRNLTVFASFTSSQTGDFHVQCPGVPKVFVDDADNAAFDWSGLLTVLASLLLVAGVGVFASGLLDLLDERRPLRAASAESAQESPADDPASAADTSSN